MASISKPFTAWGIMKLAQDGKIDLDDPAEKYLTRWRFPEGEFESSAVTIRRLLSHTAGLSLSGFYGVSYNSPTQRIEETLSNPIDADESVFIAIEPGTRFKYSGGGTTVLQLIIEEVSGLKFSEFMQAEVIAPLGMKNTTFDDPDIESYVAVYDSNMIQAEPVHFSASAAAGLSSTPRDMSKWLLATIKNQNGKISNPVLSQATVQAMMVEEQLKNHKSLIEILSGGFGLGYSIEPLSVRGNHIISHRGHNLPGWRSIIAIDENFETGLIVMTNGANGHKVYAQVLDYYTDYIYRGTNLISMMNVRIPKLILPFIVITSGFIILLAMTFILSAKRRNSSS